MREIFAGDYTTSASPTKRVSFTDDGRVKGLDGFRTYFVQEDYYDAGCDYDILYMKMASDNQNKYTWTFTKDTLYIYELNCTKFDSINDMCEETKRGCLKYRLIKN
jgi:hypothetical protein